MAKFDFKSVGIKSSDAKKQRADSAKVDTFGIKTPMNLSETNDSFVVMTSTAAEQAHDNLRNLLLTNHGERIVLSDYGADLQPLMFENLVLEDFEQEAMIRIKTAVSKYMPFIQLDTFEVNAPTNEISNMGRINMKIAYSITQLNVKNKALELKFFIGG